MQGEAGDRLVSDPGFTLRALPVDGAQPDMEMPGGHSLAEAIDKARELAHDRQYRSVMVIDPWSTLWAQFNMLWQIDEAHR
jgi:hypothetical protein